MLFITRREIFLHDMCPLEGEFVLPCVRRKQWKAQTARTADFNTLTLPVSLVRFTHTATDKCFSDKECSKLVRGIQKQDLEQGLPDIKYNFLVGWGGVVYEGRGWTSEADRSADEEHLRGRCIDIAYIGDYSLKNPTWQHMRTALELLRYGIKHKYIQKAYKVIPLRDQRISIEM